MEYLVIHFQYFLLISARIGGIFVVSPFFGSGVIPQRFKAALALIIAMIVYPIISHKYAIVLPKSMLGYAGLLVLEVLLGIAIGFLVSLIYSSFQLAGQFVAMQMGLSVSNVLDPEAQVQVPIIGQLKSLIGILVFLSIYGHHLIIKAIIDSCYTIPLGTANFLHAKGFLSLATSTFMQMFIIAIKLALPIIGLSLAIYTGLGVLAKVAPQMNIFMLGFPIQILTGFIVIIITAPIIVEIMTNALLNYFSQLMYFLHHF